jgi:hypothetical protein
MPKEWKTNILAVLTATVAGVSIMEGWSFCVERMRVTQSPFYALVALVIYFGGAVVGIGLLKRIITKGADSSNSEWKIKTPLGRDVLCFLIMVTGCALLMFWCWLAISMELSQLAGAAAGAGGVLIAALGVNRAIDMVIDRYTGPNPIRRR